MLLLVGSASRGRSEVERMQALGASRQWLSGKPNMSSASGRSLPCSGMPHLRLE